MVIMEHSNTSFLLFCCFFLRGSLCDTSLSIDTCGFSGESVSLSCTLPSAEFTQSIAWSNDIRVGDIAICIPGGCGAPADSRYSASADANGIYMTITSLTRADDDTTWKCTLLGQPASTVNLVVRDYPSACVLSKNVDGSFKCETDCGYPTSDLTIDWFINTTSAVVDLSNPSISIDTTSTPVCSSGGKASATLPASNINEDGDLYCKCGMQSACPQKALIVSGSEAVTDGPATVHLTPSTTSYTLQEGQTLPTVTCSSYCNPACTYSWTKDEQSHTTGSDIQLTNIQRDQTGVYRCTASNKYGNQTSSDVTVTVNYGPGNSISFQPNKDVLERVENQTVSDIVCFADCEPPCTYIWSNAGTTYPNPLSLSTAVRGNAGQYTCSASNSVGQGTKTWNLIVRCLTYDI